MATKQAVQPAKTMPAPLVSLARGRAGRQVQLLNLEKHRVTKELARGVFDPTGGIDPYRLQLRDQLKARIESLSAEAERITGLTDEQAVYEFCPADMLPHGHA